MDIIKVLLIGQENRIDIFKSIFEKNTKYETFVSDGSEEEDFKDFDIIIDLNFDDETDNFPLYASLKNKIIILSTVKQTIAESIYTYNSKVKSKIYGINALENFNQDKYWEVSINRSNELDSLEKIAKDLNIELMIVNDEVGMVLPRSKFLYLNELSYCLNHGFCTNSEIYQKSVREIDEYSITNIFEVLLAIYEDNKDPKFLPDSLLKKKYLKNHKFLNTKNDNL